MSPLRLRMIEDMRLRNFSACTERSYLHYVADFARYYHASPEVLGLDDIRNYQLLSDPAAPTVGFELVYVCIRRAVSLHRHAGMPCGGNRFVRMKVPEKCRSPVVLSLAEVAALFSYIGTLKHRAVLMLCYGSGLRIAEAVSLKAAHIDSSRMLIRVGEGKGAKGRYTVLSQTLLNLLRRYWKIQRPQNYLFPGRHAGTHVQPGTIQGICRDACRMAGIAKRVTPHTLRHSFATLSLPPAKELKQSPLSPERLNQHSQQLTSLNTPNFPDPCAVLNVRRENLSKRLESAKYMNSKKRT